MRRDGGAQVTNAWGGGGTGVNGGASVSVEESENVEEGVGRGKKKGNKGKKQVLMNWG